MNEFWKGFTAVLNPRLFGIVTAMFLIYAVFWTIVGFIKGSIASLLKSKAEKGRE